jgi:hypothetical protein
MRFRKKQGRAQHRLQRTAATPLVDKHDLPAKGAIIHASLPCPPLPLNHSVGPSMVLHNPVVKKRKLYAELM